MSTYYRDSITVPINTIIIPTIRMGDSVSPKKATPARMPPTAIPPTMTGIAIDKGAFLAKVIRRKSCANAQMSPDTNASVMACCVTLVIVSGVL